MEDQLGPLDFLAVEFVDGQPTAAGFDILLDLAERDVIRVLDVEFVAKDPDGNATVIAPSNAAHGVDLSAWEGASSGLLDEDDIAQLAADMTPGGIALFVLFENRWVTGLIDAWRTGGARVIAEGGIPATDLLDALDTAER